MNTTKTSKPRKPRVAPAVMFDPLFVCAPLSTFDHEFYWGRWDRLDAGILPPRVRVKIVPRRMLQAT